MTVDPGQCPTAREVEGSASSPETVADVLTSFPGSSRWGTAFPGACVLGEYSGFPPGGTWHLGTASLA